MDNRFQRNARLIESRQFRYVLDHATRLKAGSFRLYYCEQTVETTAAPTPRLGVSVAKRNIKRANRRNRVKRLVRESFRQHKSHLGTHDIVVIVNANADTQSNHALRKQLDTLWRQLISS